MILLSRKHLTTSIQREHNLDGRLEWILAKNAEKELLNMDVLEKKYETEIQQWRLRSAKKIICRKQTLFGDSTYMKGPHLLQGSELQSSID